MSTVVANSFVNHSEELPFKPFMTVSGILHAALLIFLLLASYFHWQGNQWAGAGGGGENVKVNLVGSAGIPLPKEKTVTESNVVDPTKTLNKPEEKPKPPEPPTKAEKIPEFKKEKPLPPSKKSKVFENKTRQPDNAVPGHDGPASLPTGVNNSPGSSPGLVMKGDGGGDFSSRYGAYIEGATGRIHRNFVQEQNSIDFAVRQANVAHAIYQFTITRDGTISDIQLVKTSGNYSMDNAGKRALLDSTPLDRLPASYSGSYVVVTFDFDLSMTR